ncbi:MAG: hypothetical protein WKF45_11215 [Ilumatobacteraceae bacterium]
MFERAGSLHPAKFHAGSPGWRWTAGRRRRPLRGDGFTRRHGAVVVTTERARSALATLS